MDFATCFSTFEAYKIIISTSVELVLPSLEAMNLQVAYSSGWVWHNCNV
jgi:hypothetical protein